jgi:hypothetical protein
VIGTERGRASATLLEPLLCAPTVLASPALRARLVDADRRATHDAAGALRLLEVDAPGAGLDRVGGSQQCC